MLFEKKKSLNNIPYRKLSLNCKQHSKIRKENVLRYYASFKVRKIESLFYKINIFWQKDYQLHWIAGSSAKLLIMQNYTDNTNWDVSRKCVMFLVSLSSRCAHICLRIKTKLINRFLISLYYDDNVN